MGFPGHAVVKKDYASRGVFTACFVFSSVGVDGALLW